MKNRVFSLLRYNRFEFGDQHVSQFVIFEWKRLFSIIIFYFHKSEGSQDRFHTHAFNALSFKLFGEYTEYILNDELTGKYMTERRTRFFKYFPRNSYHKIGNSNGCMTLLVSGRWKKEWKEYIEGGKIVRYTWGRENKNKR
jgi:hypothetical protein